MKALITCLTIILWTGLQSQEKLGENIIGTEENEQWGYSTEISEEGRLLVIGGPFKGDSQGSFRIYASIFGTWQRQWGINGIEGGVSGFSTDISDDGNVTVIGTPNTLQGQVNVFEKTGIEYSPLGSAIVGPGTIGALFGARVSLSGDGKRLAVGARSYDGSGDDRGYVAVYEMINGDWEIMGEPIIGSIDFALKGQTLDLSYDGSVLAVGSPFSFDNLNTGKVEVYSFQNDTWRTIGGPIVGGQDLTGTAVAISSDGNRVVVGSPVANLAAVYELQGANWTKLGGDLSISGSSVSGFSADISGDGNRVIVGGIGSTSQSLPGAVQVFDFDGSGWSPMFRPITGGVGEAYAWHCSLSPDGTHIAIGVPGSDSPNENQGHVEVYQIDPVSTAVVSFSNQDIQVFPNPARHTLNLRGSDVNTSRSVRIVDQLGQISMNTFVRNGSIDISHLSPGLYRILVPYGKVDHVVQSVVKL